MKPTRSESSEGAAGSFLAHLPKRTFFYRSVCMTVRSRHLSRQSERVVTSYRGRSRGQVGVVRETTEGTKRLNFTGRLVVTGEVDGRSRVIRDDHVSGNLWTELWAIKSDDPMAETPPIPVGVHTPGPELLCWRMFDIPTDAQIRAATQREAGTDVSFEAGAATFSQVGDDLFHKTETVDLVFMLEGDITLKHDDGEISLEPGDCIVQRGANHAWRNKGDKPGKLLVVMISKTLT
jgi:mannose-6-phosphate isomerase-like protein (cupin superfamily)